MNTRNRKDESILVLPGSAPMDILSIEAARAIRDAYVSQGVILDGDLGDGCFLTSDELSHVRFSFQNILEEDYQKNWADFFELPFNTFRLYLECSVIFLLGKRVLAALRSLVLDLKTLISMNSSSIHLKMDSLPFTHPHLVVDVLLSLPVPDVNSAARDSIIATIEESAEVRRGVRRDLPDFKSILTFGTVLDDFWANTTPDEKLFYFPVCLWWKITSILPSRPREYLVTPRDCIRLSADGEWYLTLRKNKLKGRSGQVRYKISEDYYVRDYPVPAQLAALVNEYISLTACYASTELDTLLIPDPHYILNGRSKNKQNRYYTYTNLRCALRLFLHNIVQEKYGITVVDERTPEAYPDEIDGIPITKGSTIRAPQLGDTRHISLVNMIAEGVQPLAAMELAAHVNPRQTFHYAANLDTYLRCATYRAYMDRKYASSPFTFNPAAVTMSFSENTPFTELDEGFCYSERFLNDSVEDCIRVYGPHSELGWCQRCPYFRSKTPSLLVNDTSRYLLDVEEDWALLTATIDSYRKNILGKDEDLFQVLLRAQSSLNVFQNTLSQEISERKSSHVKA
jgi:hypothetical protein